jgi:hypothetical protein
MTLLDSEADLLKESLVVGEVSSVKNNFLAPRGDGSTELDQEAWVCDCDWYCW